MFLDLVKVPVSQEIRFWDTVLDRLSDGLQQRFKDGTQLKYHVGGWTSERLQLLKAGQLEPPREHRVELDTTIDRWNHIASDRFCLVNEGFFRVSIWSTLKSHVWELVAREHHKYFEARLNDSVKKLSRAGDKGLLSPFESRQDAGMHMHLLANGWKSFPLTGLRERKALAELVEKLQPDIIERGLEAMRRQERVNRRVPRQEFESVPAKDSTSDFETDEEEEAVQSAGENLGSDALNADMSIMRSIEGSSSCSPMNGLSTPTSKSQNPRFSASGVPRKHGEVSTSRPSSKNRRTTSKESIASLKTPVRNKKNSRSRSRPLASKTTSQVSPSRSEIQSRIRCESSLFFYTPAPPEDALGDYISEESRPSTAQSTSRRQDFRSLGFPRVEVRLPMCSRREDYMSVDETVEDDQSSNRFAKRQSTGRWPNSPPDPGDFEVFSDVEYAVTDSPPSKKSKKRKTPNRDGQMTSEGDMAPPPPGSTQPKKRKAPHQEDSNSHRSRSETIQRESVVRQESIASMYFPSLDELAAGWTQC